MITYGRYQRGFTLVELVVAMTIASIIAGLIGMLIATPLEAYFAQTRRAELADSADAIVRSVAADVRSALPNSVRVVRNGTVVVLEMLETIDSGRYWKTGETGVPTRELEFTGPADSDFSIVGTFNAQVHSLLPKGFYLVVNNQGTVGQDAYALANVITPVNTSFVITTALAEDQVILNPAFQFTSASPIQRVFVVTQAIAYLCDEGAQTVTRYSGYNFLGSIAQHNSAAKLIAAGAKSIALVARYPTACQIDYQAGTAYQGGLVSLRITLANSGELLTLFHQAAVQALP